MLKGLMDTMVDGSNQFGWDSIVNIIWIDEGNYLSILRKIWKLKLGAVSI